MCRHFGDSEWRKKLMYVDEFKCMMIVVYVCIEYILHIICSLTYPCVQVNRALQLNWVHHTFAARKWWWWALLRLSLVYVLNERKRESKEEGKLASTNMILMNPTPGIVSFHFVCLFVCLYASLLLLFFILLFSCFFSRYVFPNAVWIMCK